MAVDGVAGMHLPVQAARAKHEVMDFTRAARTVNTLISKFTSSVDN